MFYSSTKSVSPSELMQETKIPKPSNDWKLFLLALVSVLSIFLSFHFIPRTWITQARKNIIPYPPCPKSLLLTQARQGSTWLLDSIEHCRYSRSSNGIRLHKYSEETYVNTELWHIHTSDLSNISVDGAIQYLMLNSSLKVFPPAWFESPRRVRRLLQKIGTRHIPVVLLTRPVNKSYSSFKRAMDIGEWATIPSLKSRFDFQNGSISSKSDQVGFSQWANQSIRFFNDMKTVLEEYQVQYDVVEYNPSYRMRKINLPNAECSISNCNYL